MSEQVHHHFILNKPFGYISQFVCDQKKKKLLGELYDFPDGTMAIGRLDQDSEGLLLLTTNGITSARVRSKSIEKEYYAQVDGLVSEASIEKMAKGVEIGFEGKRYMTLPCKVKLLPAPPDFPPRPKKIRGDHHGPTSWLSIVITEGKFRQVRKMTGAVGHGTLRLVRVRIGNISLGALKPGEVQRLDELLIS